MTSNYIDASGLHTQTLGEIVTELETAFKSIYGSEINVAANSPDGQLINILAQAKIDILDLIAQVYDSFSPTSAIGSVLDQRCALNGVIRNGATFTVVPVVITSDRVVNLVGLSAGAGTPFAVSDGAGNRFQLIDNLTTGIGTQTASFRAELAGAVSVSTDTLTTIETITLGITAVNNPNEATTQGADEETDAALRTRRSRSVSLPSTGYLEGLQGALEALDGVTGAKVYENNTDTTDGDGILPHSIWCVVEGGDDDEIADVIYKKRNAGCGMVGNEVVTIPQSNGFNFAVKFDRPTLEDLYISFTVQSITGGTIDETYLKQAIYDAITYGINEVADSSAIASIVKLADPTVVITVCEVSGDDVTYEPFLSPSTIDGRFVISTDRISITVA